MKKIFALLLALSLCVGLLAGCAKDEPMEPADNNQPAGEGSQPKPADEPKPSAPAEPFTFYWVRSGEETTVNPHLATVGNDAVLVEKIGGTLYRYIPKEDGTGSLLVPNLAASEPVSEDGGVTWNIKIDPKAAWINGEKINARTFEYSYKMELDPIMVNTAGSGVADYFILVKNATEYLSQGTANTVKWEDVGIRAVSEDTLQIVCSQKQTATEVMRHFARPITAPVYEPMYEQLMSATRDKTSYGTSVDRVMCSGPFKMESWVKGSEIIFVKNEDYLHADDIHIDRIDSRMVKDEATRMELFEKGQCDNLLLGTTGMAKYGEDPRVRTYPKAAIETIEFNHNHPNRPWLADPLFKKAIFYAMDRAAIGKAAGAEPAPFFLNVRDIGLDDGTKYRDLPGAQALVPANNGYDPELANKYMDQLFAKYNLTKIEVNLLYTEGTDYRRLASEYLQSSLPKIFGEDRFSMTLSANTFALLNSTMRDSVKAPSDKWDLCWSAWALTVEPYAPWKKVERYTTWHPRRYTTYQCTKTDELVELAKTDEYRLDDKKLADLTIEMEKTMYEDMTCAPCFCVDQCLMYSDRVELPLDVYDIEIEFGWMFCKEK